MIIKYEHSKDLGSQFAKANLFLYFVPVCSSQPVQPVLIQKSIVAFTNAFSLLRSVVANYLGIENNQQELADAEKIKRCMEIKYV